MNILPVYRWGSPGAASDSRTAAGIGSIFLCHILTTEEKKTKERLRNSCIWDFSGECKSCLGGRRTQLYSFPLLTAAGEGNDRFLKSLTPLPTPNTGGTTTCLFPLFAFPSSVSSEFVKLTKKNQNPEFQSLNLADKGLSGLRSYRPARLHCPGGLVRP